jgi:hypothetical protein
VCSPAHRTTSDVALEAGNFAREALILIDLACQ